MEQQETLLERLVVGTIIKIGKECAEQNPCFKDGEILTLVEGCFENDNGLYTTTETAPSVWNEDQKDFDSIFHLFGNDLEHFLDSEIVE